MEKIVLHKCKGIKKGITHNGDYFIYSQFYRNENNLLLLKRMVKRTIRVHNAACIHHSQSQNIIKLVLDNSLEGEKNLLILLLRLTFGVYQLSDYPQIVGGEIPYFISPVNGRSIFEKYGLSIS